MERSMKFASYLAFKALRPGGFHGRVPAGPQKVEAPPKWVNKGESRSMFFISTEMGGVWVVLETSFSCLLVPFTEPILT